MTRADDPDGRTVVDQALDLFVYAPIGLALEAREVMPKLAERGRGQVAIARLLGQVAVRKGQREAEQFLGRTAGREGTDPPGDADGDDVALPIPGYDNLRATEILALLDGLDQHELAVVADHETAHRARRTVLGRLEQLRS